MNKFAIVASVTTLAVFGGAGVGIAVAQRNDPAPLHDCSSVPIPPDVGEMFVKELWKCDYGNTEVRTFRTRTAKKNWMDFYLLTIDYGGDENKIIRDGSMWVLVSL